MSPDSERLRCLPLPENRESQTTTAAVMKPSFEAPESPHRLFEEALVLVDEVETLDRAGTSPGSHQASETLGRAGTSPGSLQALETLSRVSTETLGRASNQP